MVAIRSRTIDIMNTETSPAQISTSQPRPLVVANSVGILGAGILLETSRICRAKNVIKAMAMAGPKSENVTDSKFKPNYSMS